MTDDYPFRLKTTNFVNPAKVVGDHQRVEVKPGVVVWGFKTRRDYVRFRALYRQEFIEEL
jgi:hypothetical protein